MVIKRAKAHWMGKYVSIYRYYGKPISLTEKPIKSFVAGSRNMPERILEWARKNNIHMVNVYPDKQGKVKVWL